MKVIRTAALVAAATAAVSKAKEYARENPAKASETIDKAESFVRGKAGPKYADKVGKGSNALRKSLGLSAGSAATAGGGSTSTTTSGSSTPSATTGGSKPTAAPRSDGSSPATSPGFDPSI
jgi:hypothetical protein